MAMFGANRTLPPGWKLPPVYAGSEFERADQSVMQVPQEGRDVDFAGRPLPGAPHATAGMLAAGSDAQPKREGWRNIVGAIGDALAAAGGGQGVYAPMMEQRRRDDRDDARFQLMLDREKRLAEKPSNFLQSFLEFQQLTPEQQAQALRFRQSGAPRIFTGSDGAVYQMPETPTSGSSTQVIDGTTYYNINGEWYDNPEGR